MKIATLTLPLHTNYGGVMQAYALQKVIEELGYSSELIQLTPSAFRPAYKVILSKLKRFLLNSINHKAVLNRNLNFESFIDNEIVRTKAIEFSHQLNSQTVQQFDAYVVGSDQVWRQDYAGNIESYFFDFVKGNKVLLSYAASFGGDVWGYSDKQRKNCLRLAKRFAAISVREIAGVELCQKNLDVNAERLLDPTLLLDIKYYESLITKYCSQDSHTSSGVFSYILDMNKIKDTIAMDVANALNTDVKTFNKGLKTSQKQNFGEWLKGFKNAEFVVTDSFHGVAFSIIFNKPFIAIGNIDRGLSRFETILSVFNLRDRLLTKDNANISAIINSDIDYTMVNEILAHEKSRSLKFITTNLPCKK
jgi:hypothetical protein